MPFRPLGARVLLGIRDVAFHQEVLDFFERDPRIDVTAAVTDFHRLLMMSRTGSFDVAVLCPTLAREIRHPAAPRGVRPLLLVAEEMTVPVLREAIEVGAQGVFAWPEEREELTDAIVRARSAPPEPGSARGRVVAVCGARGGAGTTFVASHLAAAFADRGLRTVLIDVDAAFADLTVALGLRQGAGVRTIADLSGVALELSPTHLEHALFRHARGFDVLLGPPDDALPVPPGLYQGAIAILAGTHEAVVLHLPRTTDQVVRSAIGIADEIVLVVNLDLFSLYGARRMLRAFGTKDVAGRCRVVVNRAWRDLITPRDVERVLGTRPSASIRADASVPAAQDRGVLLGPRSRRAGKDLRRLADALVVAFRDSPGHAEVRR